MTINEILSQEFDGRFLKKSKTWSKEYGYKIIDFKDSTNQLRVKSFKTGEQVIFNRIFINGNPYPLNQQMKSLLIKENFDKDIRLKLLDLYEDKELKSLLRELNNINPIYFKFMDLRINLEDLVNFTD